RANRFANIGSVFDVEDFNLRAFGGQTDRGRAAEPRGRARHNRDTIFQSTHVSPLLFPSVRGGKKSGQKNVRQKNMSDFVFLFFFVSFFFFYFFFFRSSSYFFVSLFSVRSSSFVCGFLFSFSR